VTLARLVLAPPFGSDGYLGWCLCGLQSFNAKSAKQAQRFAKESKNQADMRIGTLITHA
jgi:hypothetical protein